MTPRCKVCDGMGEIRTMVAAPSYTGMSEWWSEYVEDCDRCEGSGCEPLDNDEEE
jgi:hypothetical protein